MFFAGLWYTRNETCFFLLVVGNPYPQLITPPVIKVHIFGQISDQDFGDQKIQCTVVQGLRSSTRVWAVLGEGGGSRPPPRDGPDGTDGPI